MKMQRLVGLGTVAFWLATATTWSATALGAGLDQEMQTAAVHAMMAAGSSSLPDVRMHLHHAINCLAGPKGEDFDAKEQNPCAGMGNGALSDSAEAPAHAKALAALAKGKAGLRAASPGAAQKAATDMPASLKSRGGSRSGGPRGAPPRPPIPWPAPRSGP